MNNKKATMAWLLGSHLGQVQANAGAPISRRRRFSPLTARTVTAHWAMRRVRCPASPDSKRYTSSSR